MEGPVGVFIGALVNEFRSNRTWSMTCATPLLANISVNKTFTPFAWKKMLDAVLKSVVRSGNVTVTIESDVVVMLSELLPVVVVVVAAVVVKVIFLPPKEVKTRPSVKCSDGCTPKMT